jgi:uncharacterized membrane protein YbhN (UPF0104 family)
MDYQTQIVRLAKLLVLVVALKFVLDYILKNNVLGTVMGIPPLVLLASFAFSLAGTIALSFALHVISGGRITLVDCLSIEFYTMMLNLGVASSFFSLPKIAFIRQKLGNTKDSAAIFLAQSGALVISRAILLVASAAVVFMPEISWGPAVIALCIALAAYAGILVSARWNITGRLEELIRGIGSMKLVLVILTGIFIGLSTFASYYVLLIGLGGPRPNFWGVFFSEQLSILSGFFSPMPAGLGVREVVVTESAAYFGVNREAGFSAAVIARFSLIAAQLAVGCFVFLNSRLNYKR